MISVISCDLLDLQIKEIAKAFEKKYDETLKRTLTAKCKGNYKRLAVAWVDLPDQLEQPQKKIAIPTPEEVMAS